MSIPMPILPVVCGALFLWLTARIVHRREARVMGLIIIGAVILACAAVVAYLEHLALVYDRPEEARGGVQGDHINILLSVLSLMLAALYIWLGVRAVNGRETWALRTAIAMSVILLALTMAGGLVILALNYGPEKWFHFQ